MSANGTSMFEMTKTQSEDSQNNHDVSQKELLSHEAQCISSILENTIRRIEIATDLPAVIALNSVSGNGDKELSRAIREHQILIDRLEALDHLKQESDGEASLLLIKEVKNSVRDLLRAARAHPDAIWGLGAERGHLQLDENQFMLIKGLEKFHSNVVEKLQTSLDEELRHILQEQASSSPNPMEELVQEEEEELATYTKIIDAKIIQNNDDIEHFQNSLKVNSGEELDVSLLAKKQFQSHDNLSKIKQIRIQQEIDQLNSELNSSVLENKKVEKGIQNKNQRVEKIIEHLIQSFDDEIEETQANLELNQMENEREEAQLKSLAKAFSALEVEYNQIQEKRRLAEEKRKEEIRELELKTKAAILIQACWRGYSTRKSLKNKGKSKKPKKSKSMTNKRNL
ncbi:dynein regulatory complex protein 10-like [Pungitius pungitius]|uniref:dynein regulatory complex protein 10-like n=1 Tax=Pungitius pungitius TaxID=134920 RepID=UPI002E1123DE